MEMGKRGPKPSLNPGQEARVHSYAAEGKSFREIVRAMNDAGERSRTGKKVTLGMVRGVLSPPEIKKEPRPQVVVKSEQSDTSAELVPVERQETPLERTRRRALADTQKRRENLFQAVSVPLYSSLKFLKENPTDQDAITNLYKGISHALKILDSMDQSEDGYQKLGIYIDNRGSGGSDCPEPHVHQYAAPLGIIVQRLTAALRGLGWSDEQIRSTVSQGQVEID